MAKRSEHDLALDLPDEEAPPIPTRHQEIIGVALGLVALVATMALFSYDGLAPDGSPIPDANAVGALGTWTAFALFSLVGAGAYVLVATLWLVAALWFTGRSHRLSWGMWVGLTAVVLLSTVALHTMLRPDTVAGGHAAGGLVGATLGEVCIAALSTAGTYIVVFGGLIIALLVLTDISLYLLATALGHLAVTGARRLWSGIRYVTDVWRSALPEDAPEEAPAAAAPQSATTPPAKQSARKKANAPAAEPADGDDASAAPEPAAADTTPKIVTSKRKTAASQSPADLPILPQSRGDFRLPPLNLLAAPEASATSVDEQYLQEAADRLTAVLADFGISGDVREIHPGPVVTMFEFQPRSGTKLSRIERLANEIAMALEVTRVRIVAPIPGKNAVGFELPNKERELVRLREILQDDVFLRTKAKLPLALGKDIAGAPYCVDLAKMPHLLMAGTTGSGKSVSVNTMLLSLLYKYTPEELRLLLIDPKMIEFQPYNHIPHLLLPVVTDMSQACLALKWAVDEMERRYQLFADMGSRNLASYNAKVEKLRANTERDAGSAEPPSLETATGATVEVGPAEPRTEHKLPEPLPLIVICIDELADLMMVAAKDVENSIARLAQKARASGIHLIVATQRPSTDVVTGLIKANFPARLSCQVSSGIDSRTILGTGGAEHLLGNGDMLILPPGTSELKRVQGAFVSEEEVAAVVDFLKEQAQPTYDEEILKPREDEPVGDGDEEKDAVYDQAVALVAEAQTCSISLIQRRLRIGYNRAARIVEQMEREGVVGPANGSNRREVLISPH